MVAGLSSRLGNLFRQNAFLYLVSFAVCFILAFLLFFPLDPYARQLEQRLKKQGVLVEIDHPQLRFPPGIGSEQIHVSLENLDHSPLLLEELSLRPLWLSLGGDNPGLRFSLQMFQGRVEGSTYKNGETQVVFENLIINEPLGPQLPLTMKATLESARFEGTLPFAGKNRSDLDIVISSLQIEGMQKLGSGSDLLQVGSLNLSAKANGPLIQISTLSSSGAAFDLKGSGNMRLGRTPANSSINLNLVLTPKAALDPVLKDLLSLVKQPQPDGSYQLSLRGALANLRIN